jgi:predicted PurR-regulated permease PerM
MKEGENLDWGNEELFLHEIDKRQEWIKLEKKLIERKRNRRFLILFFFLGFLGLGASVYHYMSPLDTTIPSINHELAVQQDVSTNSITTQNSNPILNADIIPAKEQINQNSIKQSQENIFKVRTQN